MKGIQHAEGDIVRVPVSEELSFLFVIARKKGSVLLGYFFPLDQSGRMEQQLAALRPSHARFIFRFGDLAIKSGEWPILGRIENWERKFWPGPVFSDIHAGEKATTRLMTFADSDPSKIETIQYVPGRRAGFQSTLFGCDALIFHFRRILADQLAK